MKAGVVIMLLIMMLVSSGCDKFLGPAGSDNLGPPEVLSFNLWTQDAQGNMVPVNNLDESPYRLRATWINSDSLVEIPDSVKLAKGMPYGLSLEDTALGGAMMQPVWISLRRLNGEPGTPVQLTGIHTEHGQYERNMWWIVMPMDDSDQLLNIYVADHIYYITVGCNYNYWGSNATNSTMRTTYYSRWPIGVNDNEPTQVNFFVRDELNGPAVFDTTNFLIVRNDDGLVTDSFNVRTVVQNSFGGYNFSALVDRFGRVSPNGRQMDSTWVDFGGNGGG